MYVSPLKALSYDIDRNLRVPLRGIGADLRVAVRTGDTPQRERQAMLREPPDILITTPESLYLMLTGRAQELFAGTESCIVDEIHAVASTKRGAHLALTLERLTEAAGREVQRIGLSATQNPLEEIGRFLVGPTRECRIVDTGIRKELDLQIMVPVDSMVEPDAGARLPNWTPWPAARRPAGRSGRRSIRSWSSWSTPTARRSCSSTTAAAPSGSRSGSTSWPSTRSRGPITARSRARSARWSRRC